MDYTPETPFDSIEGTQQFIDMLSEMIAETQREVEADIETAKRNRAERREQALRLVAHNLDRLGYHTTKSRRILNDLRTLRRLLLEERAEAPLEQDGGGATT